MRLRRLLPDPGELEVAEALGELDLAAPAPPDRPRVTANFATTLDGHIAIDGRSSALGGDADHAVFHALRARAEAVMAGTGTLRAERYGPIVRDPQLRAERERADRPPDVLAVTASASMRLPLDIPLFQDPGSRVVVLTPREAEAEECPAEVIVERVAPGDAWERRALERLRERHGVRALLCEGGPDLMGSLLAAGLVDELFLTLTPVVAGTVDPRTLAMGPPLPAPVDARLVWALEHEGELLLRYALGAAAANL